MNFIVILCFLPLVFAFKFNPMSQSIKLGENQKNAQFLIENDTAESMAIELSVKQRVMDEMGKEEMPKTTEVTIFPPQMIIPSKEKRTVRVVWTGSGNLDSEKAFRVIAEQLPLSVGAKAKKQSGIQMMMRYMAALYVTPKDAAGKLSVQILKSDPKSMTLKVVNDGNAHQVLLDPVLTLKKGENKWTLKAQDLKGLAGENVLAKSQRIFTITTSTQIPTDASTSIKVDD